MKSSTSGKADAGAQQQCGTAASAGAPLRLPAQPGGSAWLGRAARASQTLSAGECSQ